VRAGYRLVGLPSIGRDAVLRQAPQVAPELEELVETVLADQEHPYSVAVLLRDLAAVRHVLASWDWPGDRLGATGDQEPGGALAAALRRAAARIGQHYHQVTAHVAEHRSLPLRLTDTGGSVQNPAEKDRASAVYLDTASWLGAQGRGPRHRAAAGRDVLRRTRCRAPPRLRPLRSPGRALRRSARVRHAVVGHVRARRRPAGPAPPPAAAGRARRSAPQRIITWNSRRNRWQNSIRNRS
jgi:hypothetical protein